MARRWHVRPVSDGGSCSRRVVAGPGPGAPAAGLCGRVAVTEHLASNNSVIDKVARILLTFMSSDDLSLTEVAHRSGLARSTAHRLLEDLTAHRLLERDDRARYRPGRPLRALHGREISQSRLRQLGLQTIEDLNSIGLPGRIGILRNERVLYIQRGRGLVSIDRFSVDSSLPAADTAAGCALLAFLVDHEQQDLAGPRLQRTRSARALRSRLAPVRSQGVAWSRSECWPGAVAVAAPVFGAGGRVVAAVEVPMSASDLAAQTIAAARMAARSLSRALPDVGHAAADTSIPHETLAP